MTLTRKPMAHKNRWGKLSELDGRARVGTPGSPIFQAYPQRLKMLSAWRRAHKVAQGHVPVHMSGVRRGVVPSSDMSLKQMLSFISRRKTKHKEQPPHRPASAAALPIPSLRHAAQADI